MMKNKATEKQIERCILDYLTVKGIFCWKNNSVGVYDPRLNVFRKAMSKYLINGTSDILGILRDGRFLAIEVKTPTNKKRTRHQDDFINNINNSGGVAFYATSVEDVKVFLKI